MRTLILTTALTLAAAPAFAAPADDLVALERARSAAIVAGDAAALEKIYATDFQAVAGNGQRVDRATLMPILARSKGGDFTVDELSARVFGEAGVTTGRLTAKGPDGAVTARSRFTHVYVRRDGAWTLIAAQATPAG